MGKALGQPVQGCASREAPAREPAPKERSATTAIERRGGVPSMTALRFGPLLSKGKATRPDQHISMCFQGGETNHTSSLPRSRRFKVERRISFLKWGYFFGSVCKNTRQPPVVSTYRPMTAGQAPRKNSLSPGANACPICGIGDAVPGLVQGTITSRDVFRHSLTILWLWGPMCYARCLRAIVSRRQCTFLEVISTRG